MDFESRKAEFCQLSTGRAVRGGQNRGQNFGAKRYGPHAVHGGRKKLFGGEGERGGAARSILFGNCLPSQPKYERVGYATIAKRIGRIA
jgi:hypothetical protein